MYVAHSLGHQAAAVDQHLIYIKVNHHFLVVVVQATRDERGLPAPLVPLLTHQGPKGRGAYGERVGVRSCDLPLWACKCN